MLFTGDALLIRKTGRTDFQGGSPEELYYSIKEVLYRLPDSTRIFPGHDYQGLTMSTIGEEKRHNARIRETTSLDEFVTMMKGLHLEYPRAIDVALPANKKL
jgi:sulfur dioxygenase